MAEPCEYKEIILGQVAILGEFRGLISGMASNIAEIKTRVNNGLTAEITQISKDLAKSVSDSKEAAVAIKSDAKITAAEVKAEVELAAERIRGENWLTRIVTGSAKHLIGMGIVVVVSTAITTTGLGLLAKTQISKELSGQQQQIAQTVADTQSALKAYHYHVLPDGTVLSHAGDAFTPAFTLNPKTNTWEKAPTMRMETEIK